jgi:hypothetical protein
MDAKIILRERQQVDEVSFAELVIWHLPFPVRGSDHVFKYRLAFVVNLTCVLRYDNESGKGDHKHIGVTEYPYRFIDLDRLLDDFWNDVDQWSAA